MRVDPINRLVGHIAVPGDKSISHRSVLLGAICDGETRVTNFGRSADTEATIEAVRSLGITVYEHGNDTLRVFGKGLQGLQAPGRPIDCANAGTLVRLLTGILAGQDGQQFELVGDASLSARPMKRITEPLSRMGAGMETEDGHLPMGVEGRPLHGITYELPVASAQVKSAILLAGLYADGETTVVEPAPTRDHTELMGDLIVTCWAKSGRNRRCGELVARGATPAEAAAEIGVVVEGITSAPVVRDLAHRLGVEMPIAEGGCAVLEGVPLGDLVGALMEREPTSE